MAVGVDKAVRIHESKILRLVVGRASCGDGLRDVVAVARHDAVGGRSDRRRSGVAGAAERRRRLRTALPDDRGDRLRARSRRPRERVRESEPRLTTRSRFDVALAGTGRGQRGIIAERMTGHQRHALGKHEAALETKYGSFRAHVQNVIAEARKVRAALEGDKVVDGLGAALNAHDDFLSAGQ